MSKMSRWLIAGSMLGLLGAGLSMSMPSHRRRVNSTVRRSVAQLTSKASREAGDLIADWGASIARNIR